MSEQEPFRDRNGEILKEGFYYDEIRTGAVYFTGEYNQNNYALIEFQKEIIPVNSNHAWSCLCRIRDPRQYAENKQKEAEWMTAKLGKLEDTTLDLPIGLPSPHIFMLDPQLRGDHGPHRPSKHKKINIDSAIQGPARIPGDEGGIDSAIQGPAEI